MSYLNLNFLSEEGLNNIKNYKYVSGDTTAVDKLMIPILNSLVSLLPMSVAPNLLSVLGFVSIISGCGVLMCYDPSLTEGAPSWVYFLATFGVFWCYIFDSIDGIQARRTGSGSPMGVFVDHGLDSMCFSSGGIILVSVLGIGSYAVAIPWIFFMCGKLPLLCKWQYYGNVFCQDTDPFDFNVRHFIAITICLSRCIFGQAFFDYELIGKDHNNQFT